MELNLVNYIRIDLASPLDPPIVFKDKNPIYGYRFADGLMWVYDTENGEQLVFGIGISSIKAVWFNEAPYMSSEYSTPEYFKNITEKWKMFRIES